MSLTARILVVDDDAAQRSQLAGFLRDLGAEVDEAADGRQALAMLPRVAPDIVLTDMRMPELDGRGLQQQIHAINPEIAVVIVTAYGTVADAVGSLKHGAVDYLLKPLDLDEVEHVVRRAIEHRHLQRENRELRRRLGSVERVDGIVTAGGEMDRVLSMVTRVAGSGVSVLIVGESGTGKELIARAIHAAGPRATAPFVAVNASALSPTLLESELFGHEKGAFTGADRARSGRFEAASDGTLFLDEIGDLPADVQVKLLRVLQENAIERVGSNRPTAVDVRLVAATHRDLAAEMSAGRFRDDLFYRIAVVTIDVPPLRSRRADIPLLVEHFIRKYADDRPDGPQSISREAMDLLLAHDFPGNVRELENIIRRSLVMARGELITTDDLPPSVIGAAGEGAREGANGGESTLPAKVAALEQAEIDAALATHDGNQSRAARELGISERALRYKLAKFRDAS